MNLLANRGRLLGGAALGLSMAMAAAQPAQASCTITTTTNPNDTYSCANTTTTDTTGLTGIDRDVPYDSSGFPLFVDISAGVTIDGFGMAFTNAAAGPNTFNIINNGVIQVNAGNTPLAGGGSGALYVTADGNPVIYTGTGSIANLGTGDGFEIVLTNAASLNATIGGNVSAAAGEGVSILNNGTGTVTLNITGAVTATGGEGIAVIDTLTGGDISVTTEAVTATGAIDSDAIEVLSDSATADVTIVANGVLTADNAGVVAAIIGVPSTGDINVTTNDAIDARFGIDAENFGTGSTTVNAVGPITFTNGNGIFASSSGGAVSVTAGAISGASLAIFAQQLDGSGTGAVSVTTNGVITGIGGIVANNFGTGNVMVTTAGAVNSGAGDGVTTSATSGTTTISLGANVNSGNTGVVANSTTGAVSITSTSGTITATLGDGIAASTTTGALSINSGAISAGAVGIYASTVDGALSITQTGALTSADIGIDVQVSGTGALTINRTGTGVLTSTASTGIQADTTTGALTITTGAISAAAGDGVDATSTTGAIIVNATGAISATGGDGIRTTSTTGNQTVTVSADVSGTAVDGVHAVSDSGNLVVNVTAGTVSGIDDAVEVSSAGTQTVNVSSGAVLTGAYGVYGSGTGAFTVNNGGTIGGSQNAIIAEFGAAATVNNNATGTLNGTVDLGNQADTINNRGIWNVSGINTFNLGVDLVSNIAGGTINIGSGATFDGLENFTNAGTVNATGTIAFTGVATTFNNLGLLDTTGATTLSGLAALNNSGTLDLAAGTFTASGVFTNAGFILADEGTTNISGQTSFANSGTIDLSDGLTNDQLTIFGDFAGSGGSTLLLDVDDGIADQLIITGAASGTTTIDANLIGTGILDSGNVLLVTTGTATDGAFVLGNVTGNVSPLFDYAVEQDVDQFYLVSTVNEAGFAPLPVTLVAGEMWYQSAEAVWAQAKLPNDGTGRSGIWGQIYASRDKAGGNDTQTVSGIDYDVSNRVETDRVGFQIGAGFQMGGMGSIGVTGGLERADADGDVSGIETRGWNIGAYGMFGGPVGFHGSVLAKHDRFDIDFGGSLFDDVDQDARSNGVDGEVGYRFGGGDAPSFGFSAGLSHVRTKIDDFSLGGLTYDYDRFTSTRGRIGGRVTGSGPMSLFADARVYHEFSGDGDVSLSDGVDAYRLTADGRGTWVRFEAGVGGPASGVAPMVALWVDVGDVKGFGGRGSFRF